MIFRFLPDAKIAWRDVWLGAGVTTVLFIVGKIAIGLYLGQSGVATILVGASTLVRSISSSISGVTANGCGFQSPPRYLTCENTNCSGRFSLG